MFYNKGTVTSANWLTLTHEVITEFPGGPIQLQGSLNMEDQKVSFKVTQGEKDTASYCWPGRWTG